MGWVEDLGGWWNTNVAQEVGKIGQNIVGAGQWAGEQLGLLPDAQERQYQSSLEEGRKRLESGNAYQAITKPSEYVNINQAYTDAAMNRLTGQYGNTTNFLNAILGQGNAYDVNQFYNRIAPTITNYVRGEMSPLEQAARERMDVQGRATVNMTGDEFAGMGSLYSGAMQRTAADRVGAYNAQTMEALNNTQAQMMQNLIQSGMQSDLQGRLSAVGVGQGMQSQALQGITGYGEQNYVAPTMALDPMVQMYLNSVGGMPTNGGGTDPLDLLMSAASLIPGSPSSVVSGAGRQVGRRTMPT